MTILFPTLAIAFAAFCVWLTVRIINRREWWAIWLAVVIGMLIYVVALIFCFSDRQPAATPPSTWID